MLSELFVQSVTSPSEAARRVLGLDVDRNLLWVFLIIVACLGAVFHAVAFMLVPMPENAVVFLPRSPVLVALLFFGLMVLSVYVTDFVGRAFDGKGNLDGALKVVALLQYVLLVLQVIQLVALLMAPPLGQLMGLGIIAFNVWFFVICVAELHGFASRAMVFLGVIVTSFGIAFALGLIATIVGLMTGMEFPNV